MLVIRMPPKWLSQSSNLTALRHTHHHGHQHQHEQGFGCSGRRLFGMLLLRFLGGQLSFLGFDMLFGMATLGFGMDCMVLGWLNLKWSFSQLPFLYTRRQLIKIKIGV